MPTENTLELKIGEMARAGVAHVERAPEGGRRITFRASTQALDRHNSRIKPAGLDTANFSKNPIFLWGHDGYGGFFSTPSIENVLGRIVSFDKTEDHFDIDVEFLGADVNPRADMALGMTRAGALNTVSIGFIPREILINMENDREVPIITKAELLEVSLVPIPSNPEAVALVRSMLMAAGDPLLTEADVVKYVLPQLTRALEDNQSGLRDKWATVFKTVFAEPPREETPPADAADPGVESTSAETFRRSVWEWQVRHAIQAMVRTLNH